jgi:hypothetical protein
VNSPDLLHLKIERRAYRLWRERGEPWGTPDTDWFKAERELKGSRTAREAGLHRLYHYEKFDPDYLTDLATKQRVHCSDPANLNDPWDCKPWFSDEALDDPAVVDKLIDWLFSMATHKLSEKEMKDTRRSIHSSREYRVQMLDLLSQGLLKIIAERWRIYCLTPFPDSTLMWSHYGNNHKGIWLEFGLESQLFGSAMEVAYVSSYPKWTPHRLEAEIKANILLTKSERIPRAVGPLTGHPLSVKDGFSNLPKGALRSVIAGCQTDHEKVKEVVRGADPTLKVKRVVRAHSKYHLEIAE